MELKIFRDALPAAGTNCTLKAELPLETEILISDYLPPVFKLVKCFVRPVVLQKRLQPGKLQLEGYLRCVVYYQGEDGDGLVPDRAEAPLYQAAGSAGVRLHGMGRAGGGPDRISELPHRQPAPHRGAGGVWAGGIGAYAGQNGCHHGSVGWRGGAETGHPFRGAACRCAGKAGHGRGRDPLSHAARRRFGSQRQCLCRRPQAPERESRCQGRAGRFLCLACRGRPGTAEARA